MAIARLANLYKQYPLRVWFVGVSLSLWLIIYKLYSAMPAQFESEWTLILPGSGDGHAVNLESIGQASSSNPSPYGGSSSLNPSANYKAIALSHPVLNAAAKTLEISRGALGAPSIKLVDQTSLIHFKISANTAEQAELKGWAMYHALQNQLVFLRDDEQSNVNQAMMEQLDLFGEGLRQAQANKLSYQVQSDVLSAEQFELLITNLESERMTLSQLQTKTKAYGEQIKQLQHLLGIEAQQVREAMNLRNDLLFQQFLKRHAELHAQLATVEGSWGENHPKRLKLDASHVQVENSIKNRGRRLTNNPNISVWTLIEIGDSQFENGLFSELAELIATKSKLDSEVESLQSSLKKQHERIEAQTPSVAYLEDLNRRQQVATAVFTTAIAKKDIGKVNRFSSYPLVQLLSPPTHPEYPKKLKPTLLIIGALFCNVFIALGLLSIWYRKRSSRKTPKSA